MLPGMDSRSTILPSQPLVSVVILNYNGKRWLKPCLESLKRQTIVESMEVIVADNASTDGSDQLAADLLRSWPGAKFVQNGGNFGYCEGNNLAAREARGRFLFFLNNDTLMAPNCMEVLLRAMRDTGAGAGSPQILNYQDGMLQGYGRSGFDPLGYYLGQWDPLPGNRLFIAPGCAYCIRTDTFRKVGGFDPEFFMYVDETDLSWRVWISGEDIITVPEAKLFHWGGGATVQNNASASEQPISTTLFARFHGNRNSLLVFLKNAQHLLLLLALMHLACLAMEAIVLCLISGKCKEVGGTFMKSVTDLWRLRHHVLRERAKLASIRRRSDFWMLRFLHPLKLAQVETAAWILRAGLPRLRN
ncbi:MAG: glycosyltransferase family 2 protein [Verrucomicrobia bacterium]|nr:glycosyltransferase family 2 protein [Verrucomicrobiota bacterium]